MEEKSKREKEFYESLFRADNSLNTQLKTSEDGMLRLKRLNFSHPHGRYFTAWCTMRCKLCSIEIDTTQLLLRINISHILSSFFARELRTAAHARMASNGQSLTDEWVKNSEYKERRRKEDEDRNNKVRYARTSCHTHM